MSEKNVLVATYGSLRVGMQNARVNDSAGATYVGKGRTVENFDLFQFRGAYFPSVSLAHHASECPVVVDVFATDRAGLCGPYDRLEGYPSFYNRTQIQVMLDSGEEVTAWIYHIDREQPTRVETGDWCTFVNPDYYKTFTYERDDEDGL